MVTISLALSNVHIDIIRSFVEYTLGFFNFSSPMYSQLCRITNDRSDLDGLDASILKRTYIQDSLKVVSD